MVLVAIAAGAGVAGTAGYNTMNPPRPDPFTGSEGRNLQRQIDRLDKDLHTHLSYSQRKVEQYDAAIAQLLVRCDLVLSQLSEWQEIPEE